MKIAPNRETGGLRSIASDAIVHIRSVSSAWVSTQAPGRACKDLIMQSGWSKAFEDIKARNMFYENKKQETAEIGRKSNAMEAFLRTKDFYTAGVLLLMVASIHAGPAKVGPVPGREIRESPGTPLGDDDSGMASSNFGRLPVSAHPSKSNSGVVWEAVSMTRNREFEYEITVLTPLMMAISRNLFGPTNSKQETTDDAPYVYENGNQALQTHDHYPEVQGCYYNFEHYEEGDRILTNEPCLNCTCHNHMLMCYLRVCPFTKAIGQDCTVEKKPDQCCPVITCPQVPVQLLTSSTTQPPTTTTALGRPDNYGCMLDNNTFYPDGAQVADLSTKKECVALSDMNAVIAISMFQNLLNDYSTDYEEILTTPRPTVGLVTTPGGPMDCQHEGQVYHDGEMVTLTEKAPCEHCYCMRGDIVCAVQDCGTPLEGVDCTPIPPSPGHCCPSTFHSNGTLPLEFVSANQTKVQYTEPVKNSENKHDAPIDESSTADIISSLEKNDVQEPQHTLEESTFDETPTTTELLSYGGDHNTQQDDFVQQTHVLGETVEHEGVLAEHTPEETMGDHIPEKEAGEQASEQSPDEHVSVEESDNHILEHPSDDHKTGEATDEHTPEQTDEHKTGEATDEHTPEQTDDHKTGDSTDEHTPEQTDDQNTGEVTDEHTPEQTGDHKTGETTDEHVSGQTSDAHISGETTDEHVSGQTSDVHVSGETTNEHTPGQTSDDHLTGETTDEHAPGQTSDDHVTGEKVDEHASGQTSDDHVTGETVDEHASGHTSDNHVTGETVDEHAPGQTSDDHVTGETVDEHTLGQTSNGHVTGETVDEHALGQISSEHEETPSENNANHVEDEDILVESFFGHANQNQESVLPSDEHVSTDTGNEPIYEQTADEHATGVRVEENFSGQEPNKHISGETADDKKTLNENALDQTLGHISQETSDEHIPEQTEDEHTSVGAADEHTSEEAETNGHASSENKEHASEPAVDEHASDEKEVAHGEGVEYVSHLSNQNTILDHPDNELSHSVNEQGTEIPSHDKVTPGMYTEISVENVEMHTSVPAYNTNSPEKEHENEHTPINKDSDELAAEIPNLTEASGTDFSEHSKDTPSEKDKIEDNKLIYTEPSNEIPGIETTGGAIKPFDTVSHEGPSGLIPQPGEVPGEGSCLVDGKTYPNEANIPTSSICQSSCRCVNSIVHCDRIECAPPPGDYKHCMPVQGPDACCPTYICDDKNSGPLEAHSQLSGGEKDETAESHQESAPQLDELEGSGHDPSVLTENDSLLPSDIHNIPHVDEPIKPEFSHQQDFQTEGSPIGSNSDLSTEGFDNKNFNSIDTATTTEGVHQPNNERDSSLHQEFEPTKDINEKTDEREHETEQSSSDNSDATTEHLASVDGNTPSPVYTDHHNAGDGSKFETDQEPVQIDDQLQSTDTPLDSSTENHKSDIDLSDHTEQGMDDHVEPSAKPSDEFSPIQPNTDSEYSPATESILSGSDGESHTNNDATLETHSLDEGQAKPTSESDSVNDHGDDKGDSDLTPTTLPEGDAQDSESNGDNGEVTTSHYSSDEHSTLSSNIHTEEEDSQKEHTGGLEIANQVLETTMSQVDPHEVSTDTPVAPIDNIHDEVKIPPTEEFDEQNSSGGDTDNIIPSNGKPVVSTHEQEENPDFHTIEENKWHHDDHQSESESGHSVPLDEVHQILEQGQDGSIPSESQVPSKGEVSPSGSSEESDEGIENGDFSENGDHNKNEIAEENSDSQAAESIPGEEHQQSIESPEKNQDSGNGDSESQLTPTSQPEYNHFPIDKDSATSTGPDSVHENNKSPEEHPELTENSEPEKHNVENTDQHITDHGEHYPDSNATEMPLSQENVHGQVTNHGDNVRKEDSEHIKEEQNAIEAHWSAESNTESANTDEISPEKHTIAPTEGSFEHGESTETSESHGDEHTVENSSSEDNAPDNGEQTSVKPGEPNIDHSEDTSKDHSNESQENEGGNDISQEYGDKHTNKSPETTEYDHGEVTENVNEETTSEKHKPTATESSDSAEHENVVHDVPPHDSEGSSIIGNEGHNAESGSIEEDESSTHEEPIKDEKDTQHQISITEQPEDHYGEHPDTDNTSDKTAEDHDDHSETTQLPISNEVPEKHEEAAESDSEQQTTHESPVEKEHNEVTTEHQGGIVSTDEEHNTVSEQSEKHDGQFTATEFPESNIEFTSEYSSHENHESNHDLINNTPENQGPAHDDTHQITDENQGIQSEQVEHGDEVSTESNDVSGGEHHTTLETDTTYHHNAHESMNGGQENHEEVLHEEIDSHAHASEGETDLGQDKTQETVEEQQPVYSTEKAEESDNTVTDHKKPEVEENKEEGVESGDENQSGIRPEYYPSNETPLSGGEVESEPVAHGEDSEKSTEHGEQEVNNQSEHGISSEHPEDHKVNIPETAGTETEHHESEVNEATDTRDEEHITPNEILVSHVPEQPLDQDVNKKPDGIEEAPEDHSTIPSSQEASSHGSQYFESSQPTVNVGDKTQGEANESSGPTEDHGEDNEPHQPINSQDNGIVVSQSGSDSGGIHNLEIANLQGHFDVTTQDQPELHTSTEPLPHSSDDVNEASPDQSLIDTPSSNVGHVPDPSLTHEEPEQHQDSASHTIDKGSHEESNVVTDDQILNKPLDDGSDSINKQPDDAVATHEIAETIGESIPEQSHHDIVGHSETPMEGSVNEPATVNEDNTQEHDQTPVLTEETHKKPEDAPAHIDSDEGISPVTHVSVENDDIPQEIVNEAPSETASGSKGDVSPPLDFGTEGSADGQEMIPQVPDYAPHHHVNTEADHQTNEGQYDDNFNHQEAQSQTGDELSSSLPHEEDTSIAEAITEEVITQPTHFGSDHVHGEDGSSPVEHSDAGRPERPGPDETSETQTELESYSTENTPKHPTDLSGEQEVPETHDKDTQSPIHSVDLGEVSQESHPVHPVKEDGSDLITEQEDSHLDESVNKDQTPTHTPVSDETQPTDSDESSSSTHKYELEKEHGSDTPTVIEGHKHTDNVETPGVGSDTDHKHYAASTLAPEVPTEFFESKPTEETYSSSEKLSETSTENPPHHISVIDTQTPEHGTPSHDDSIFEAAPEHESPAVEHSSEGNVEIPTEHDNVDNQHDIYVVPTNIVSMPPVDNAHFSEQPVSELPHTESAVPSSESPFDSEHSQPADLEHQFSQSPEHPTSETFTTVETPSESSQHTENTSDPSHYIPESHTDRPVFGQRPPYTHPGPLFPIWSQKPHQPVTTETPHLPEEFHYPAGPEQDYEEEDDESGNYGPGTCRYGGKVYLSAQQIPRDDPCDFCFCFRSDIICLQQSCPPPIQGCYQEAIKGFCCPRYECHVSMATMLNLTTTTTTTTTTLPPHFFPHAYKGAAVRAGCQVKGVAYRVGERIRSTSGPCLQCRCGANGQMKCDPTVCGPQEALLRQVMDAAAVSRR
ncbi:hypothetical protein AAG570_000579 [Ranatra chinensis]|uniref:VWFC domain-containing protein n=1 Tax=Ranatra chinensis TaxID=642074 RepID=A0ABD0YXH4_9HEMI